MIEFFQVSKYHTLSRPSLDQVSLKIEKGEMVVFTGKSGSGKSTLLHLVYMKERPTQGRVCVDTFDSETIERQEVSALRRKVGMIFQEPHLLDDRNVFDNVALPLQLLDMGEEAIRETVEKTLTYVGLQTRMTDKPLWLSTGERQRVCIARALVCDPLVLLADEPTGNLDPETSLEILRLLRSIHSRGTAVIIATHQPLISEGFACRHIHLDNGRIVSDRRATLC